MSRKLRIKKSDLKKIINESVKKINELEHGSDHADEYVPLSAFSSYGTTLDQIDAMNAFKAGIDHHGRSLSRKGCTVDIEDRDGGVLVTCRGRNAQRKLDYLIDRVWDDMYDLNDLAWNRDENDEYDDDLYWD